MRQVVSVLSFFFLVGSLFSQPTEVGSWRDYLPYNNLNKIVEAKNYVYGASDFSLVEFDKRDNTASRLSKVQGLSDIGVSALGYHAGTNTVIVGYENGNIDFIKNGKIENFPDIKRASLVADKIINGVIADGDYAYLACGFGIVQLDMTQRVVRETFYIGAGGSYLNVTAIAQNQDSIFAATDQGMRYAAKASALNDYNFWVTDNQFPYPNEKVDILTYWRGNLLANIPSEVFNSDSLMIRRGTNWGFFTEFENRKNHSVRAYNDSLLVVGNGGYQLYNSNLEIVYEVYNYNLPSPAQPGDVILAQDEGFWVADREFGFVKNRKLFDFDIANLDSPFATDVHRIETKNGHVWVAAGSRSENYQNRFNQTGVYHKKPDETWEAYNGFLFEEMDGLYDFLTIAIDPFDPTHVFAGGLSPAMVEIKGGDVVQVYDTNNSPLKVKPSDAVIGIDGMRYDAQGNLWLTNMGYSESLLRLDREGNWTPYSFGNVLTNTISGDVIVDNNGFKWFILPNKGKGVIVFNDAGTPDDSGDDEFRLLTGVSGNGGLPTTDIYSIEVDQNGEVWVGTNLGIAVFYNAGAMFLEGVNTDAQRIRVNVNGYIQFLLETETVSGIAIDGANRKWLATNGGGLFLMSADGTQQIYHFTETNSPLFSNTIRDIAFDDESGEILIGTNKGLQAFKTTSTGGDPSFSDVYAYPNPVRREYDGVVAIKGLATNSSVRITDINGNLVFTSNAEGGQVIWNTKNMNGERVQTGVYLVFSADGEGSETNITKIMVLN